MEERTFGQWLRAARNLHKPQKISQDLLARRTGIDRGYLSKIENDKVGLPLFETRQRIHAVLGTSDADVTEFGVRLRRDFAAPAQGGTLPDVSIAHGEEGDYLVDDSPLSPEEEAIFIDLVFRDYSKMTNSQKRMIVEATRKALGIH